MKAKIIRDRVAIRGLINQVIITVKYKYFQF